MKLVCPCGCGHIFPHDTTEERFWNQVDKSGDCWLWVGLCKETGYGVLKDSKEGKVLAHRLSYAMEQEACNLIMLPAPPERE